MSASKALDLAQIWIESTTEFDWDELPENLRIQILTAAFSFCVWAANFERVIEPDQPKPVTHGPAQ